MQVRKKAITSKVKLLIFPMLLSFCFSFALALRKKQFRVRVRSSGPLFRKPVNTNPGLEVNQSINFSCIKLFFGPIFCLV